MPDDFMTQIQNLVRTALPAHLSDELQKVLTEGQQCKRALDEERQIHARTKSKVEDLDKQLSAHRPLAEREVNVAVRERDVAKREQDCRHNEVRLECANARLVDLKEITLAVFQNNHFKYQRTGETDKPVLVPGQMYPTWHKESERQTVEGQS